MSSAFWHHQDRHRSLQVMNGLFYQVYDPVKHVPVGLLDSDL